MPRTLVPLDPSEMPGAPPGATAARRLVPLSPGDIKSSKTSRFVAAGGAIEKGYESLAKPVTGALEHGQEYLGIPESVAKPIAETVVPQTATGAALTGASFLMPELGVGKILGEAAGPVATKLGEMLPRAAAMGGIGAGVEKLTGGTGLHGFEQGAGGELLSQGLHGAIGMITRRTGLQGMLEQRTKDFGSALTQALPWLGKIESASDIVDKFVHGDAHNTALLMSQQAKSDAAKIAKNETFAVHDPVIFGAKHPANISFEEADRRLTEMQHQAYLPKGDPRSGQAAPDWAKVAAATRKVIVDKLNAIQPGAGDNYDLAKKRLDAAFVLGGSSKYGRQGVFRPVEDVLDRKHGTINVPKLIERIQAHSEDLQRTMGKPGVKSLIDALRGGYKGEMGDIPAKSSPQLRPGFSPAMTAARSAATLGGGYKPVGKTPASFKVPHKYTEALTQNLISEMRASQPEEHSPGPGMKALDTSRAEAIAPTLSASKRATETAKDIQKGKQPDVHKDLNRGRLSMDETNKIIQHASSEDPMAMVQGMPLSELMDAVEQASPEERQVLLPLVKQRLMKELPQEKNRTLQMNLSKRFMTLQQMPAEAQA